MTLQKNFSLKKYNTFGMNVSANQFIEINSLEELQKVLKKNDTYFILSGGSNMLLTKNITKTVLHINIKGIIPIKKTDCFTFVEVNAGEIWHDFVLWSIKHDLGGVENLSLIPGYVGASPIQNIGAYGVEAKDSIDHVKAIEIRTGKKVVFTNETCQFGYRNSIFKTRVKGQYIITSVVFKLSHCNHQLHFDYGAIQNELSKHHIKTPTIQDISNAIIHIRKEKLPDPNEIGNSGSFFKNPVVNQSIFDKIQKTHPNMPFYKIGDHFKIPAGWLIEQCGFKGKRYGNVGVHEKQALVLVNYGNANGNDILNLAKTIQKKVANLFFITLEMEVNIF